jgi:hypothetical protein
MTAWRVAWSCLYDSLDTTMNTASEASHASRNCNPWQLRPSCSSPQHVVAASPPKSSPWQSHPSRRWREHPGLWRSSHCQFQQQEETVAPGQAERFSLGYQTSNKILLHFWFIRLIVTNFHSWLYIASPTFSLSVCLRNTICAITSWSAWHQFTHDRKSLSVHQLSSLPYQDCMGHLSFFPPQNYASFQVWPPENAYCCDCIRDRWICTMYIPITTWCISLVCPHSIPTISPSMYIWPITLSDWNFMVCR